MANLNYSRQREAILQCLRSRRDHPTADAVYTSIREVMPDISKGTVYRNLTVLEDLGEIRRIRIGAEPDRFDGFVSPHQHFICNTCGCMKDIFLPDISSLDRQAESQSDCTVFGHEIFFYGICDTCKSNQ